MVVVCCGPCVYHQQRGQASALYTAFDAGNGRIDRHFDGRYGFCTKGIYSEICEGCSAKSYYCFNCGCCCRNSLCSQNLPSITRRCNNNWDSNNGFGRGW